MGGIIYWAWYCTTALAFWGAIELPLHVAICRTLSVIGNPEE